MALAEVFLRRGHRVPAGLMGTVAVGVVPAVAYALLSLTLWPGGEPTSIPLEYPDFYTYISGGWVALEGAVLVAAGPLAEPDPGIRAGPPRPPHGVMTTQRHT